MRALASHANRSVRRGAIRLLSSTATININTASPVPTIPVEEYQARRRRLLQLIADPNAIAVIPGHGTRFMNANIFYPFHQAPNFRYLSGFVEPDSVLAIGGEGATLFTKLSTRCSERWDGPSTDPRALGLTNVRDSSEFCGFEEQVRAKGRPLFYDTLSPIVSPQPFGASHTNLSQEYGRGFSRQTGMRTKRVDRLLDQMRLVKSEPEIQVMRDVSVRTSEAFVRTMSKGHRHEHQIYAEFDYQSRMNGLEKLAFVPVVAAGANGLAIHYTRNSQAARSGDMVLMDAGATREGYISDLCRTWPVDGKFSRPQRALYEATLRVQERCIEQCKSGLSLDDLNDCSIAFLMYELNEVLGWSVSVHDINDTLYPHYLSHHIGLDVHDCSSVSREAKLMPGHVIAIEVGVYVPFGDERFPRDYWGMAIRIEDNVLVTRDGCDVLSASLPKSVEGIEAILSGAAVSRGMLA